MRCLFLAPMKPPDHPDPSGDRTMARSFMQLLQRIGYETVLASGLRTWIERPCATIWAERDAAAEGEIARLVAQHHDASVACVFAYHVYYRAPDLIGPRLAAELGVPYVVAEGSRAPKQARGDFAHGHRRAEAALDAARLVLCLTSRDRAMIERLAPAGQFVADLKPFLDMADWPNTSATGPDSPPRLIAVGMMRDRAKLQSYLELAEALPLLRAPHGGLDVIGDGPARPRIEAAFQTSGGDIRFHGAIRERKVMTDLLNNGGVFVWPAVSEAFGMALLEAQAHGLPCIAGDHGGVRDAMIDGVTGFVTPSGDMRAFAAATDRLLRDAPLRLRMGAAARRFAREDRSMERAALVLKDAFGRAGIGAP